MQDARLLLYLFRTALESNRINWFIRIFNWKENILIGISWLCYTKSTVSDAQRTIMAKVGNHISWIWIYGIISNWFWGCFQVNYYLSMKFPVHFLWFQFWGLMVLIHFCRKFMSVSSRVIKTYSKCEANYRKFDRTYDYDEFIQNRT